MSVLEAAIAGASSEEILAAEMPSSYKAAYVEKDDAARLWDQPHKDVRETLKVGEVPTPELAPDEVVIAVMSSAMNYNTIWSARFEPIPGFVFLNQLAKKGGWNERHDRDYHVLGSDTAGIVVRIAGDPGEGTLVPLRPLGQRGRLSVPRRSDHRDDGAGAGCP